MPQVLKKPVSLTELFYDLVFVYAVSQITEVFEPLRENEVTGTTLLLYIAVFIGFISSWNIQTVYFNRFGEHNFKDIISMTVLQMPILLFMAQHAHAQSYEDFQLFGYGLFALSLVDVAQYVWIAIERRGTDDARESMVFILMLSGRSISILVGAIVGGFNGLAIVAAACVLYLLAPILSRHAMSVPLNGPHLIERLQLLTIITLGELIVGQAQYFSSPNIFSLISFIVIVNLFMFYIVEFDHMIDENRADRQITWMIYYHYLIWFGINLVTVAYDFIDLEHSIMMNAIFTLGLALFYLGVLVHTRFNKDSHRPSIKEFLPLAIILIVGLSVSCLFLDNYFIHISIVLAVTFLAQLLFIRFNLSRRQSQPSKIEEE
ncbi:low temperature requirement protein A [Alloscardovia theropitheci]|uniref:Low temperature requirement protein A n=1 Tax=Alloscardovia theropitheci TaxID=2496842 RepID=A0A4R0QX37_9BIFI|nr:low temperature requirement protein A [Alloscardovia theropitheci]TCD55067.1 low temperature requirement protein A [Alloscardovia theropitheci]